MPCWSLRPAVGLSVVLLLSFLVGCEGDDPADDRAVPAPRVDLVAPTAEELAPGIELGDMTPAAIVDAAAVGDTVVLVGAREVGNGVRPLVLVSRDGGGAFEAVDVEASTPTTSFEQVAGGDEGFVAAVEDGTGVPALWASDDGTAWEPLEAEGAELADTDSIVRIRHVAHGYVAVGTSSVRAGSATNRTVVWTSADGRRWHRSDLGAQQAGTRGAHQAVDVVSEDGDLVLVTTVTDEDDEEQPTRMEVWRSSDEGRSFAREATPRDLGATFRVDPREAVVTDGRIEVALQGDGGDPDDGTWGGGVLQRTQTGWRVVRSPAWDDPSVDDGLRHLVRTVDGYVAAGWRRAEDGDDAFVTVGTDHQGATALHHPLLAEEGAQHVNALVPTPRGVLVVGRTSTSGVVEPFVLVAAGGTLREVDLPTDADEGVVSAYAGALVETADGLLALGSSAGSPVAWGEADGIWRPHGLPGLTTNEFAYVRAGVPVADTSVLVGQVSRARGSAGAIWTGRGGSWRLRTPGSLQPNGNGYGTTNLQDVAADGETLVTVGASDVNGQSQAFVARSTDGGTSWDRGATPALRPATAEEDWFGHLPDAGFAAPGNGGTGATTVLRTTGGWLAAGWWTDAGERQRAVIWESADGVAWTPPRDLPAPDGLDPSVHGTSVAHATEHDGVLVLAGPVAAEDGGADGWVSWTRDSDGTWRAGATVGDVGASPDDSVAVNDLVAVPDGWLAVGREGTAVDADPVAWTSSDGVSWRTVAVADSLPATSGAQAWHAAHVRDDEVVLLGSDVRADGGGVGVHRAVLPVDGAD